MPPYRQIAAIIKRGILSGQYPPDTRIPTESELVETYEVARSTARRAVAALYTSLFTLMMLMLR